MGTPAVPTIYTASGGLEIVLEIGAQTICERTRYLTNDLIARAHRRGWSVRAPPVPEQRSSVVMLELERPAEIVEELLRRDIVTDQRSGLVRVSPYFYNTIEEILAHRGR
ncbi:MAG TPA: hypothetical protein VGF67_04570 [Ktedonobacteraceae bacterium]|jgi:selenocysteine lyase/cysteine desulfurase